MPPRIPRNFDVNKALSLIGLTWDDMRCCMMDVPHDTPNVWERRGEVFREKIKKAHRDTMRLTHPDLHQDGEKERALERTKLVNEAVDVLMLLRPGPQRLVPQFVPYGFGNQFASTTTSAGTHFDGGTFFGSSFFIRVHRG